MPNRHIETLADLDIAILHVERARDIILPLWIPVATECCYLTSTLDGLRTHRRAIHALIETTSKEGE